MIGPRKVDKPLVLYGFGKLGHLAEEVFKELGIPIHAIVEKTKITSLEQPLSKDALVAVCVATEPYGGLKQYIKDIGFKDIVPVWDIIIAYPEIGISNGWFLGDITDEDEKEMGKLIWDDEVSFMHRWAFVNWHMLREEWPRIVIDKTPDSDRAVLPSTLVDIKARRKVMLWSDRPYHWPIDIHAEGRELETLEANMDVFKKHRWIFKVACYHSRDGLWKIPKILMENLKDYIFIFRMTAYMGTGAYMYCVPKERA